MGKKFSQKWLLTILLKKASKGFLLYSGTNTSIRIPFIQATQKLAVNYGVKFRLGDAYND